MPLHEFISKSIPNNFKLKFQILDHLPTVFIEELGERPIKDDIEFIAGNNDKCISFIVKIIAKLTWVTNKHGKNLYIRIFS